MRPHKDVDALTGHLAMAGAILVVVGIVTIIDVQLSVSHIDPENPATSPNMAPEIRYYFIPVLSAFLSLGAALINFFLQLLDRRRIQRVRHWVLLGLAFCLVLLGFPLTKIGFTPSTAFALSLSIALAAFLGVRWRCGVPLD